MQGYIIFEIDKGNNVPTSPYYWRKATPNVYKLSWSWEASERDFSYGSGGYGYGFYGGSGTDTFPAPVKDIADRVGSLIIDSELYTRTGSISECDTTNKSFYFDIDDQILYVNFLDNSSPWDYIDISLGVSDGYVNKPLGGNADYETRIVSLPALKIERDSLYFGKVAFSASSVTLNNTDHHFDTFDQDDVFGKLCRIKFSSDGETFTTLYSGKLDDFKLTGENIVINLKDPRRTLETEIPTATFNKTDYPGIDDNLVGTVIPIGYNKVIDSPAYSLDETASGSFDFKFCYHSATSIQEIRVNNVAVTATATDLTGGEFTLSSSDYSAGDEVTIDYTGKNITNPLDIIEDLLTTYTTTLYNSTFFNIPAWEAVKNSITVEIGLGLIEAEKLCDVIGRISQSIFGSFITDGDGRFNFKVVDNEKSPVKTIYAYDLISPPTVNHDSKEYLSSAKIEYNKGIVNEKAPAFINTDDESDLFTKYDIKIQKDFETLLLTETDADSYSDKVLDQFGGIFPAYTLKTKLQAIDLELEDLIDAQLYIHENRYYYARLEILSKIVNYLTTEVTIAGRLILFRDQSGAVVDLPKGSKLIRRLTKAVIPDILPNDIIIVYDNDPDYIINFDSDPDYVINYQD